MKLVDTNINYFDSKKSILTNIYIYIYIYIYIIRIQ